MMQTRNRDVITVNAHDAAAIEVGPGCLRRDLPGPGGARAWVVEIVAGHEWPHVDIHDGAELVYVVSGDLIEGGQTHGPGSYLFFAQGSRHRPRTSGGVTLFGVNLAPSFAPLPPPSPTRFVC
jgi:hypothetical protein